MQPQWLLDSANWRVLAEPSKYGPGAPPPPHLSPFVNDEEEGYVPDYAMELRKLQVQAPLSAFRHSSQGPVHFAASLLYDKDQHRWPGNVPRLIGDRALFVLNFYRRQLQRRGGARPGLQ